MKFSSQYVHAFWILQQMQLLKNYFKNQRRAILVSTSWLHNNTTYSEYNFFGSEKCVSFPPWINACTIVFAFCRNRRFKILVFGHKTTWKCASQCDAMTLTLFGSMPRRATSNCTCNSWHATRIRTNPKLSGDHQIVFFGGLQHFIKWNYCYQCLYGMMTSTAWFVYTLFN